MFQLARRPAQFSNGYSYCVASSLPICVGMLSCIDNSRAENGESERSSGNLPLRWNRSNFPPRLYEVSFSQTPILSKLGTDRRKRALDMISTRLSARARRVPPSWPVKKPKSHPQHLSLQTFYWVDVEGIRNCHYKFFSRIQIS